MFQTRILVRFGDLDAAGIAYYPNLVNFLHEAFEDFFVGHVGRPYPEAFEQGLASPTVKLEMEFLSPVRYGDHVDIAVGVEHVGRTSLRMFTPVTRVVIVTLGLARERDWLFAGISGFVLAVLLSGMAFAARL